MSRARAFLGRWANVTTVVVAVCVLAIVSTISKLAAIDEVNGIESQIAGGSATCSGGNLAACDRVCLATQSRLVVYLPSGEVLRTLCVRSKVTSMPGSRGSGRASGEPSVPSGLDDPQPDEPSTGGGPGDQGKPQGSAPSTPTTPAPSTSEKPAVGVKAPAPVQVCVPPLVGINC